MCPKIQIDQLLCSKMAGGGKVTAADKNSLHHCLLSQERWLDRETGCSDPTRISNISSYLSVRVQAWYPRNGWHGASCWHLSLSADSRHGVPASNPTARLLPVSQAPAASMDRATRDYRRLARHGRYNRCVLIRPKPPQDPSNSCFVVELVVVVIRS